MSETRVREALAEVAKDCQSALDVGCGPLVNGRAKYQLAVPLYWGIDARLEFGSTFHGASVIRFERGVLPEALSQFDDREFDLVYALDVIEHLERDAAERMLAEMIRIAAKCVVIFTPNGFRECQRGTKWLEHLSGWTREDLEARGFHVEVWDFDYGMGDGLERAAGLWAVREA